MAYIYNFPYYKSQKAEAPTEINVDRKSEKVFKEDQRFMGPLYAFVAIDAATWVWAMCVVSRVYPSFMPEWIFDDKICKSLGGFALFTFVWGYMGGVNGLAGHELIHRREAHNKALGMFTYTKILYSHFVLEHGSGHHRNVATPDDSATALKGEIF